jgi:hypothetical protein
VTQEEDAFRKAFCNGVELPEEVRRCLAALEEDDSELGDFIADAEVFFLDPEEPNDLLTFEYLNDQDRKNDDTMANVEATDALFGRIAWLFSNDESILFGYWIGEDKTWAMPAEAVSYDTEGQFDSWGKIPLGDLIAYAGSMADEEGYERIIGAAKEVGLSVLHETLDSLYAAADEHALDIEKLHTDEYNKGRVKRGLEPFEG